MKSVIDCLIALMAWGAALEGYLLKETSLFERVCLFAGAFGQLKPEISCPLPFSLPLEGQRVEQADFVGKTCSGRSRQYLVIGDNLLMSLAPSVDSRQRVQVFGKLERSPFGSEDFVDPKEQEIERKNILTIVLEHGRQ